MTSALVVRQRCARRDTPPRRLGPTWQNPTSPKQAGKQPNAQDRFRLGAPTVLGFFLAEAFPSVPCAALQATAHLSCPLTKHHLPTKPKPTTAAAALQWMEAEPGEERGKKGAVGSEGLEWELERQFAFEREMLLMAAAADAPGAERQKLRDRGRRPFAADLLQNCDLPPPAKLFGPVPTLQRLESAAGTDQKASVGDICNGNNDSLLRALRLSQSRAREAEEKLAAAGASNGDLAALLVRDSLALSAYRRWMLMLEAENSLLRGASARGAEPDNEEEEEAAARRGGGVTAWWVALAVCVSIAGVGLALGRFLC